MSTPWLRLRPRGPTRAPLASWRARPRTTSRPSQLQRPACCCRCSGIAHSLPSAVAARPLEPWALLCLLHASTRQALRSPRRGPSLLSLRRATSSQRLLRRRYRTLRPRARSAPAGTGSSPAWPLRASRSSRPSCRSWCRQPSRLCALVMAAKVALLLRVARAALCAPADRRSAWPRWRHLGPTLPLLVRSSRRTFLLLCPPCVPRRST
mmetsp:Transcript_76994/g.214041  ORF Transcript_76994/g.214041 Transcript_76994/m.214041 type:complete len:209 (+) Transcript_76994:1612-2238(+)